jgi:hypothetical protein
MLDKLFLVTGSIFEPQKYGLEAIIVWLPCGLTSIRWELFDFLKKINNQIYLCDNNLKESIFSIDSLKKENIINEKLLLKIIPDFNGLKYIYIDLNLEHRIEYIQNIQNIVNQTMNLITKHKINSIGMNGIRTTAHARQSEKVLIQSAINWINKNKHNIDKIYLIDKRGGFEKHKK